MFNQSVTAANNGTNLFDGATPLWQYAQPLADMGKLEIVNGDDTPRFEYQKTEHGIKVVNREDGHRFELKAMDAEPVETVDETEETEPAPDPNHLPLTQFLADFGSSLFDAVSEQNTPIYQGETVACDEKVLSGLTRQLFPAQKTTVNAICRLLFDNHQPAGIINAEMGTGKTMMAIATAAVAYNRGYQRTLVLSPPHLVYKWRREILATIPNARVVVLNGADTLSKLIAMKKTARRLPETPEFYILGRVRMRMDYHWKPAYTVIKKAAVYEDENGEKHFHKRAEFCCPDCGSLIVDSENKPFEQEGTLKSFLAYERRYCEAKIVKTVVKDGQVEKVKKVCNSPLWSLCRKDEKEQKGATDNLLETLCKLPSIGKRSATKLIDQFGVDMLASMLEDSPLSFMNLQDENGDMVFSDKQALKLGRALGKIEFSQGKGGYQPTEFIKRYLPKNYFGLLVVDEGHEYKNYGTAQGQAMGTLARSCQKILCLTGTLMGGYADDLFYLLWRLNPNAMIEDGFVYNKNRSLGTASHAFMEQHGVLKEIIKNKEYDGGSFSSSRATRTTTRTARAPGFSPLGLMRYVLPMTVFLKLKDIGQDVLPPYSEHFHRVFMPDDMAMEYQKMQDSLQDELKSALASGDNSLTGVVTNALLSWTECCYKPQEVFWRSRKETLWTSPALFDDKTPTPKEAKMLEIVQENLAKGRKCLVYTVYSDTKDTTGRLKNLLAKQGIKASVLKASVKADEREDWVDNQIDAGCEVLICNPELVKTGLDLLQFPTIFFMQTGYNVYTVMQAARRSWRIGQTEPVEVHFAGYSGTAGEVCLELMGKKISVSQSTSGDMPENGLEILNQEEASIEVELAKRLIDKA